MNTKINLKTRVSAFLSLLIITAVLAFCVSPVSCGAKSVDLTGKGIGYSSIIYNNTNGLPTSDANSVVQTNDGFIWIGSYSGLIRYDGNDKGLVILDEDYKRVTNKLSTMPDGARIRSIHSDKSGNIRFGTNSDYGLVCFDPESENISCYTTGDGLASNRARTMLELSNGNIAVADTFDAIYSTRPYRNKMELPDIIAEVRRCSGTQLNAKVVDALLALIEEGAMDQPEGE